MYQECFSDVGIAIRSIVIRSMLYSRIRYLSLFSGISLSILLVTLIFLNFCIGWHTIYWLTLPHLKILPRLLLLGLLFQTCDFSISSVICFLLVLFGFKYPVQSVLWLRSYAYMHIFYSSYVIFKYSGFDFLLINCLFHSVSIMYPIFVLLLLFAAFFFLKAWHFYAYLIYMLIVIGIFASQWFLVWSDILFFHLNREC